LVINVSLDQLVDTDAAADREATLAITVVAIGKDEGERVELVQESLHLRTTEIE
jgi:hypothetical protein